jgi:hypothetical protein
MSWVETASANFTARHEERDDDDVEAVLNLLEDTRERVGALFATLPREVTIVLHSSGAELDLAQPFVPVMRRLTAPAARRYVAGWASRGVLHVLAPRRLAERAASIPGSPEILSLSPAALYIQLVVAASNPSLPPPWTPRSTVRAARWAWLVAGTAQWFSGQTGYAGAAIARRLREDRRPDFPPSLRDAALLGGSVIDLVALEEGAARAAQLACSLPRGGPREALVSIFHGRAMIHTEGTWRAHLARLAGQ